MNLDIDDNVLYSIFWIGLFSFLISIVAAVHFGSVHTDELIAQLVKDGEDPTDAACAMTGNSAERCKLKEIDNIADLLEYVGRTQPIE